jgi:hypothetical protein
MLNVHIVIKIKWFLFFGYDNGTKKLVTLCCHKEFNKEDLNKNKTKIKYRRILEGEYYKNGDEFFDGIDWVPIKFGKNHATRHKKYYLKCRRIITSSEHQS